MDLVQLFNQALGMALKSKIWLLKWLMNDEFFRDQILASNKNNL